MITYYQGRRYVVFHAKSHPVTYVWVFPDKVNSGKHVTFAYNRRTVTP